MSFLIDTSSYPQHPSSVTTTTLYTANAPQKHIPESQHAQSSTSASSAVPPFLRDTRIIRNWTNLVRWIKSSSKEYRWDTRYDESYIFDTYYDNKQHKVLFDSDLYIVLWPKDGRVGPKDLNITNDDGIIKMQFEFGLPFLMRVGNIERRASDKTTIIYGNYIHPQTKRALIPPKHDPREPDGIMGRGEIPDRLYIENPFVHLPDLPEHGQIYISSDCYIYGFRTTNEDDVKELEHVTSIMAYLYDIFNKSLLFCPILSAIQRLINDMNTNPKNMEASTYLMSKAMEDYDAEVIRIRNKIPPQSGGM